MIQARSVLSVLCSFDLASRENSHLKQKTHRMLAWGVLGSASDGLPFLLTHPVVFRSM